jgi:predicted outer membrane repeat protein
MPYLWQLRRLILNTLLLLLFLSLLIAPTRAASIIFVVPGGAGVRTGTDWANASDLIAALTAARPGDQLWVAMGTYTPTTDGDRTISFQLANGVLIYGGFAGAEMALSQRNWLANITVLSGEIGAPGNSDNSFHVITANSVDTTAVLDGFTISGGRADAGYDCSTACGGGMYSNQSSPRLDHLLFRDNTATQYGGGIYNQGSSASLTDVVFLQNSAEINGGGMYNVDSNPTIINATFSSNTAVGGGGGAIYNQSSNPVLTNAVLSDNTAVIGGGMSNNQSSPLITSVTLTRNRAKNGGGIFSEAESNAVLSSVTFLDNTATGTTLWGGRGGGMLNDYSSPAFSQVTFQDNTAMSGGGLFSDGGRPSLNNVTFRANHAANGTLLFDGGGGLFSMSGDPILRDVVFSANSSSRDGGGIFSESNISLTNVTFNGNTATNGGGMSVHVAVPTLTNVLFEGNSASSSGGGMLTYASTGVLTNVTFLSNAAPYGGGIVNIGGLHGEGTHDTGPIVINAAFKGNTATDGGAMLNRYSSPTIINSVFNGNVATYGGAIYNEAYYGASRPVILNTTFSGNTATDGGAVYNAGSQPIIRNSIVWDNRSDETATIANTSNSTARVSFSIVDGDLPPGTIDEGGNRSADPLFAVPVPILLPSIYGDLRLLPGSAAIDAATTARSEPIQIFLAMLASSTAGSTWGPMNREGLRSTLAAVMGSAPHQIDLSPIH